MRSRRSDAARTRVAARRHNVSARPESLEERLPLTADLALGAPLADQVITEGDTLDVDFTFTDTVATSSGSGVGLNPADFTSLGDFTATSDLYVNTSDTDITFTFSPLANDPPLITIPALSLWAGDENGGTILETGTVWDQDGASGPMVETLVLPFDNFTLGAGFTLTGLGERPLALLANGDLTVDGTVDVSAQRTGDSTGNDDLYMPGAGGGAGGRGISGGQNGSPALGAPVESAGLWQTGFGGAGRAGSGGGHGGVGGDGGNGAGQPGGDSFGDLATIGIQGGSGGGAGAPGFGRLSQGGDGGGGIELGATGDITINGSVLANAGPTAFFFGATANGGGGAGGGILVHGDDVTLGAASLLQANATAETLIGEGAGGEILVAHAGTLTNNGVDNLQADPSGASFAPEAVGVVNTEQTTPEASQDNYTFVVDLLDAGGALIAELASGSVTDIVLNTAGDALTGAVSLAGLNNVLFADDADLQVRVTVSDDQDTPNVDTDTFDLTVANAAPESLAIGSVDAVVENGTATLNLTFDDAGLLDEHTVTVTWGDGATDTVTLAVGERSAELTHQYLDDHPATGTASDVLAIGVTVSDDDGDSAVGAASVTVTNEAPVLSNVATDSSVIYEGKRADETVTLTADFSDVGTLDTHTVTIDWGDGAVDTSAATGGAITATHEYAQAGFYDVVLTLTDDDTGESVSSTQTVISGVGLQDGVLIGIGTNGDDAFKVFRCWGTYHVLSRLDGGGWEWSSFSDTITGVDLLLGGGHDIGFVSGGVHVNAFIDAGAGDDLLVGGSGDDILLGGDGYDLMFGRGGRDLLFGGAGGDAIFGDGGQDVLVSGTTAFDADRDALDLILAEWTSDKSYAERVDNLSGDLDLSQDGLNGEVYLIAEGEDQTVFDDESLDWLVGGRGRDLYFAGEDDIALASFWEVVEDIEAEAPTT